MNRLDSAFDMQGSRPRKILRPGRLLIALVLAVVIALLIFGPFTWLFFSWDDFVWSLRYLVELRSGFPSFVLALFLLFSVPGILIRLGGTRGAHRAPAETASTATYSADELVQVPSVALQEMKAGHRWEMAQALGIPWRPELIHDHRTWVAACHEAAERKAERIR